MGDWEVLKEQGPLARNRTGYPLSPMSNWVFCTLYIPHLSRPSITSYVQELVSAGFAMRWRFRIRYMDHQNALCSISLPVYPRKTDHPCHTHVKIEVSS